MPCAIVCLLGASLAGCGDSSPRPRPPAPFTSGAAPAAAAPAMPPQPAAPANISTETSDPAWLQCGTMEFPKPTAWAWVKPTAAFRTLQYRVPGGAELIVSVFPAGDGGDVDPNVERWRSQFRDAAGQPAQVKRTDRTVAGVPVVRVDFAGAFKGMGMTEAQPGMSQLGAIVRAPAQSVFLRLLGPKEAVEAARSDFERMVDGLRTQQIP